MKVRAFTVVYILIILASGVSADDQWKKHVLQEGKRSLTAVAGDFSGDGLPDVIAEVGNSTILFVAPDWQQIVLDSHSEDRGYIHSECFDIDGDGDLDYVGARYNPGLITWLEQPEKGASQRWKKRLIADTVHGIHGLMQGDIDSDGKPDLLATSAQAIDPHPESLVWFSVPSKPKTATKWHPNVFAQQDAPGLTHYIGVGDINNDGRLDAATGAKGGPTATSAGEWFAWWEAPAQPQQAWKKHLISDQEPGATNIHPADVNGDGKLDFIASRGHGKGIIWFEAPEWNCHEIDSNLQEAHCLAAVDMDSDGDIDAATCAYGDKIVIWYENDGKGHFTPHLIGENQEAYDIRTIDIDLDGDLDLLLAGRASNNVAWYENPRK
jgi:hypothetical protein